MKSKNYIVFSLILLALVFSFGTKVSAENDGDTPNTVRADSAINVKTTTDVTATMSKECLKVDANLNGKIDAGDFATFEKFVNANDVIHGDMDGNKIINANDFQAFTNAYARCNYGVNTGVTGGIKPMPGPAPVPTSDDAIVQAQLDKCKTLTDNNSINNCIKVIRAKFPTKNIAPNSDQKNIKHDNENENENGRDDDQVGSETPEQIKMMRARFEQRFAEFNALYTRLTKLADLIDGRIKELDAQKVDMSHAKMRLASARTHLSYARNSIDSTIKIYQTYGPTSNVIRASAEIARNQLGMARNDLISATKDLRIHDDKKVTLSDACKAFDMNSDSELTAADFASFEAKFKAGDNSADADRNGSLNANDYQAFNNGFAGCNSTSPKITPGTIRPVKNTTEPAPVNMKATINTSADVQVR